MRRVSLFSGCVLALLWVGEAHAQWGTIEGRIVWGADTVPAPDDLTALLKGDPAAVLQLRGKKLLSDRLLIHPKNRGFQHVFVWLSNGDPKQRKRLPIHEQFATPARGTVEIDQPLFLFTPPAIALRAGQTLIVKNSSQVVHCFRFTGNKTSGGELNGSELLAPGKSFVLGPKEGLDASAPLLLGTCPLYPWMSAFVRVFDHPYFALTDADGRFTLKDAPAGKFNLIIWHPSLGWRGGPTAGATITIDADKTTDLGEPKFSPPS